MREEKERFGEDNGHEARPARLERNCRAGGRVRACGSGKNERTYNGRVYFCALFLYDKHESLNESRTAEAG
jgi:hypothetical protein